MTRSRRKSPFAGISKKESDKDYKVAEHKRERRAVKQRLGAGASDSDRRLHSGDRYGSPNRSPKDGKGHVRDRKDMRK